MKEKVNWKAPLQFLVVAGIIIPLSRSLEEEKVRYRRNDDPR